MAAACRRGSIVVNLNSSLSKTLIYAYRRISYVSGWKCDIPTKSPSRLATPHFPVKLDTVEITIPLSAIYKTIRVPLGMTSRTPCRPADAIKALTP